MNKIKQFLVFLSLIISNGLWAQTQITCRVLDYDTHLPVSNVEVYLYAYEGDLDTTVYTDHNGRFTFRSYYGYDFDISKTGYLTYTGNVEDDSILTDTVFYIYSNNSESYKLKDIASDDVFDMSIGFDLFSPDLSASDDKFKSVFSFYYAYEVKTKIANNFQLGFRYEPIKMKWMTMNSDTLLTSIPHQKERYFQASGGLDFYLRYIFNVQGLRNYRGAFMDVGAGYSLPYYFSYTYFTEDHLKTVRNHIHNFKDFSAMVRIGYYIGSIKATYRFTDIMKDDFIQPPKFTLGLEFNIPFIDEFDY